MEPQYDLRYLRTGLELLKDYLFSEELYWEIGVASPSGSPAYPQMTLGNLLFANARLSGRRLEAGEKQEVFALRDRLNEVHSQWSVAWEKKATQEYDARLRLWGRYLDEYRKDPSGQADRFSYEVRRRVILDLLDESGAEVGKQQEKLLNGLDQTLKSRLVGNEFVWEDVYRAAFPNERYWYLYGRLPQK